MTAVDTSVWVDVCALDDLVPNRGACVLVGRYQYALFRVPDDDTVYAVSNYDPFGRAYVLSRGIVGSAGDAPKVASPLYKQSFDLRSGICLQDPTVRIATFTVRVVDGRIEVQRP